jgi:hypothetical protein
MKAPAVNAMAAGYALEIVVPAIVFPMEQIIDSVDGPDSKATILDQFQRRRAGIAGQVRGQAHEVFEDGRAMRLVSDDVMPGPDHGFLLASFFRNASLTPRGFQPDAMRRCSLASVELTMKFFQGS